MAKKPIQPATSEMDAEPRTWRSLAEIPEGVKFRAAWGPGDDWIAIDPRAEIWTKDNRGARRDRMDYYHVPAGRFCFSGPFTEVIA